MLGPRQNPSVRPVKGVSPVTWILFLGCVLISIRPLANLIRSDQHAVYGILASATHRELERLYAHARDVLGGIYLPYPVVVHTLDEKLIPAMCYIAPIMEVRPAANEYVDRICKPAREYGFPAWYIHRLECFRAGEPAVAP